MHLSDTAVQTLGQRTGRQRAAAYRISLHADEYSEEARDHLRAGDDAEAGFMLRLAEVLAGLARKQLIGGAA